MSDRDYIALPREVATFLCGEVSLDGVWFGDKHPNSPGQFWWREFLRAALVAPTVKESLTAQLETLREENEKLREEIKQLRESRASFVGRGMQAVAELLLRDDEIKRLREQLPNAFREGFYRGFQAAFEDAVKEAALRQEDKT